jgi:zinc protease
MYLHIQGAMARDAEGKEGTGHLVGRLLAEGTKKRTSQQIANTIEFVGGNLSSKLNGLCAKILSPDLPLVLDLISEIVQSPAFLPTSIRREKEKIMAELLSHKDDASYHATLAFHRLIYGKHPYAMPQKGTEETIVRIRRKDLLDYHRTHFLPNRAVLAMVGDIVPQEVQKIAQETFGAWKAKDSFLPPFPEVSLPDRPAVSYIELNNKEQLVVYFGHIGIRRTNPDYYKLLLLDHILGQSEGFTDRISNKMREELGLCYAVECSITSNAGVEPGTFTAFLATTPEKYKIAMKTLEEEISKAKSGDVSEEELENAKAYLTGNFVFALEDNDSLSTHLVSAYRFHLGFDYISRFPQIIKDISLKDIQEAAQKYLHPEVATTVVVGPVKKING